MGGVSRPGNWPAASRACANSWPARRWGAAVALDTRAGPRTVRPPGATPIRTRTARAQSPSCTTASSRMRSCCGSASSAVLPLTRSVVYLDDGDIAVVTASGHRIIDREAREQSRAVNAIEWDVETLGLGGYRHFMLKEICEQTEKVRRTMR